MSTSDRDFLKHILDEIEYLLRASSSVDKRTFLADETLKRAFARSFEIIGEAMKRLPAPFRSEHTDIEWSAMAAMRDRLIHAYFGVDYELVWDVVETKLPSHTCTSPRALARRGRVTTAPAAPWQIAGGEDGGHNMYFPKPSPCSESA